MGSIFVVKDGHKPPSRSAFPQSRTRAVQSPHASTFLREGLQQRPIRQSIAPNYSDRFEFIPLFPLGATSQLVRDPS
jgi:hypothetical protein